ncbi:MAG: hypothetical protein JWQ42_2067 [Edaphobacter sp.]|nr:hypothetical protein [Edaphobacter sp.]
MWRKYLSAINGMVRRRLCCINYLGRSFALMVFRSSSDVEQLVHKSDLIIDLGLTREAMTVAFKIIWRRVSELFGFFRTFGEVCWRWVELAIRPLSDTLEDAQLE